MNSSARPFPRSVFMCLLGTSRRHRKPVACHKAVLIVLFSRENMASGGCGSSKTVPAHKVWAMLFRKIVDRTFSSSQLLPTQFTDISVSLSIWWTEEFKSKWFGPRLQVFIWDYDSADFSTVLTGVIVGRKNRASRRGMWWIFRRLVLRSMIDRFEWTSRCSLVYLFLDSPTLYANLCLHWLFGLQNRLTTRTGIPFEIRWF